MPLTVINPENVIYTVNGRRITQWGTSDAPLSISTVDAKREMTACMNGDAVLGERVTQIKEHTLNLLQHGTDSAYLSGVYNSAGGLVSVSYTIMNTGESFTSLEGSITNLGDLERAGVSPSDDSFTMVFNRNTETRGDL
jgi:hypothetical protein